MKEFNILPLGSVVKLKNGDGTLVMVVARGSLTKNDAGEMVYFDYGSCIIPNGLQGNKMYFFNQEDIEQVIFKGYVNLPEQQFEKDYPKLIEESKYKQGKVD